MSKSKNKITYKSIKREKPLNYSSSYLDKRYIDSFNAPTTIILSKRGLGKTFGYKLEYLKYCIEHNKKLIYVVSSKVEIETLCENNGEKFFSDIIAVLSKETSKRKKKILSYFLGKNKLEEDVEVIKNGKENFEIKKGLIVINNKNYGYIISLNDFSRLKRNSFTEEYNRIIVDEFIPEVQDVRTLNNPYKLGNIFQSIFRRRNDVKCVMLGNTIRRNDPILLRLKIDDLKPREVRQEFVDGVLTMVAYRIAEEDYPKVKEEENESFSGRMNILLNETTLQDNVFKDDIDSDLIIKNRKKSKYLYTIYGDGESIRVHKVNNENMFYIFPDYQDNLINKSFCVDKKVQSPGIIYRPYCKEILVNSFVSGLVYFYDFKTLCIFKNIMGVE